MTQRTADNPNIVFAIFDGFRALAEWLVTAIDNVILWLTWVGTIAAGVLIVLRYGGWRPALIVAGAFVSFALMGLWEESMQTLALMSAAVVLSLAIGVPLGMIAGRSDRFYRTVTPALDAMQIVPAFAYLMPVVILFSVGPAAAVICTMIYAIPPAVRITALGIRESRRTPSRRPRPSAPLRRRRSSRSSSRSRAASCSCRSTRRSCSRSRWW